MKRLILQLKSPRRKSLYSSTATQKFGAFNYSPKRIFRDWPEKFAIAHKRQYLTTVLPETVGGRVPPAESGVDRGRFYEVESVVMHTARQLGQRLDELNVDYVALGAIAMNYYGIPKDAYKVEFLVSPEGLAEIHRALEHPYTTVFPFGRKKWVNTTDKVSIDFYVSGEYPGDGIRYPSPHLVTQQSSDGMKFISLPTLIDLKLSSDPGSVLAGGEIDDVREIMRKLLLSDGFVVELHPNVRPTYLELMEEISRQRAREMEIPETSTDSPL